MDFQLRLELDADFADQEETVRQRQQFGELQRSWRRNQDPTGNSFFDYRAHHHYEHQGDIGDPAIHRSITFEIAKCQSEPNYSGSSHSLPGIAPQPLQSWHACIRMCPQVEDEPSFPLYDCYGFQPSRESL